MKRILINATQAEELRVAMVNGQILYDFDIELPSREQKKSNIYKGVITRVEPSLEAAFINYGADRHGFLPFKEISRHYFADEAKKEDGRYNIKDAIKVDQELIVQVEKEERGNKGAALTSLISLAGRFLVCMPQNPRAGGVSRRIEGEDRDQVRKVMSELNMPNNMGVIARTAGVGRSSEEMQWDLDYLNQLWTAIEQAATEKPGPFLIYQESDIVIRALRDHYKSDVGEILIDSQKAYDRAHEFMAMVMPNTLHKLKKFDEKLPLFNRFQIESQIESAFNREVSLPSGGAIVIDHTEALTSIDINSARSTKGGDIEETAFNTNLEAADEIARQLRIRDLGGLIVIDFIDMLRNKNQRDVEQRLRRAVYDDRARVQIGRISRFGLLEMSRQRLRPSLGESSQIVCPRCQGQGTIRDIESLSLSVLRLLEEESLKENTGRIVAKLPVECATYLLNEKRGKIAGIEDRNKVHCVIVPDPNLETPHFHIERVRDSDALRHESSYKSSYEMTSEEAPGYIPEQKAATIVPTQTAAVQRVTPPAPKPQTVPADKTSEKETGIFSKMMNVLFGYLETEEQDIQQPVPSQSRPNRQRRGPNRNRQAQNRNRNQRDNRNQQKKRQPSSGKQTQVDGNKNLPQQKTQDSQPDNREHGRPPKKSASNRSRSRNPNRRNPNQNRPKSERSRQNDTKPQPSPNAEQVVNENTRPVSDQNAQKSTQKPQQRPSSSTKPKERPEKRPQQQAQAAKTGPKTDSQTAVTTKVNKTRQQKPAGEKQTETASKPPAPRPAEKSTTEKVKETQPIIKPKKTEHKKAPAPANKPEAAAGQKKESGEDKKSA